MTIGGINGAPSPNGGVVSNVGALGVAVDAGTDSGFDVSPTGVAYAALTVAGATGLNTINLTTGAANLVGTLPASVQGAHDPPPRPGRAPVPDTARPALLIAPAGSARLAGVRRSGIVIPFSCSEACTVTAKLVGARKTLGSATVSIGAAGVGRVGVRLSALGRKTLRTTRRLAAQAVVVAKDPAGNSRIARARVLLVA